MLKRSDTWKIQLTIATDFISSKYANDEERAMHSKSDNIEIMINGEADEVIEELFKSFLNRYQNNLEKFINGINYIHYCIINVIK